jgi:hypothetical protein
MLFIATLVFAIVWCWVSFSTTRRYKLGWVCLLVVANIIITVLGLYLMSQPAGQNPLDFDRFETIFWIAMIWLCLSWGVFRRDAAEVQQKVNKLTGFVVVSQDGLCLGPDFQWHEHASLADAHVHSKESLLNTGSEGWRNDVYIIYPATHDQETRHTDLDFPMSMTLSEFLTWYSEKHE